ncbi:transposase [Sorangium sp. So ce269]
MGVRLAAHDREGRERLFRYGARPPFALERFSELADGRIAYRLKAPNRRGQTHRVMTPVECLARLCALVPPPWQPLVRFHGVFAPNHAWRPLVVPSRTLTPASTTACRRPPQRSLFPRAPCLPREDDDTLPRPRAPRAHSPPRAPGRRTTHASNGPRCSRAPLRSMRSNVPAAPDACAPLPSSRPPRRSPPCSVRRAWRPSLGRVRRKRAC